jgi:Bacterial Ig-like domain (group 3)
MRSMFRSTGGFGRRLTVLAAAAAAGAALPAAGLWAGTASAQASTTTVVTSSANPSTYGESVTFTADVTSLTGAVGTVAFTYGLSDTVLCAAQTLTLVTGDEYQATCTTSTLPVGTDSVEATYSGVPDVYLSSDDTVSQVVNTDSTYLRTGIFFNAGQTYTVWASLSYDHTPLDGESITFKVGHTTLCTATTNSDGYAWCDLDYADSVLIARNDGMYQASFAGTTDYAAATAEGNGLISAF